MVSKRDIVIIVLILGFIFGFILFIDEIHLVFPPLADYGIVGGFLGDWSAFHIEPFHHYHFGIFFMILFGAALLYTYKKW